MKTETESLRELDAWIGIHIFGKKAISRDGPRPTKGTEDDYFVIEYVEISGSLPRYTKGAQLQQLLEKCVEKTSVAISKGATGFWIGDLDKKSRYAIAETQPLALCRFAKLLFSK